MPALSAGIQAQNDSAVSLKPGERQVEPFAGQAPLVFSLDTRGPVRITVDNIGRDAVLEIRDASGERLLRAAAWRRAEHYYVAAMELSGPVTLLLSPDVPYSPPGQVGVLVERMAPDDPSFAAEREMSTAMDLNLAYYYGEGDTRVESLKGLQAAAQLFAANGDDARHADALFEAANINLYLCDRENSLKQLEAARKIWTALKDERGIATAENLSGLILYNAGDIDSAISLFKSASDRRARTNGEIESYFYAESVNNLGLAYRDKGDARRANEFFRIALDEWDGNVDLFDIDYNKPDWQKDIEPFWIHHSIVALGNIGWANEVYGALEESERIWNFALNLAAEFVDDENRHAVARPVGAIYNNIGNLKRRTGDMEEAMLWLDKALVQFTKTAPDTRWAALVKFNIGQVYRDLGRDDRARDYFQESLRLRTSDCDPVGRAESLVELAALALRNGDTQVTFRHISEAENLLRPLTGNSQGVAAVADLAGRTHYATKQYRRASERHQQAIQLYREAENRNGEMLSRTNDAVAMLAQKQYLDTTTQLLAALRISEEIDAPVARFRILKLLGETYLADGRVERAINYADDAIALSEVTRRKLVQPSLLRQFSAIQRGAYDVLITGKLQKEDHIGAWQAADEARARRFTDVIRQAGVDLKSLTKEQAQRFQRLRRLIALRAETRSAFLSRKDFESADKVLGELQPLLDEMDLLQEIARRSNKEAVITPSLADVQQQLRPADVILEYHVGDSASGVWSIASGQDIVFRPLPNKQELIQTVELLIDAMRSSRPLPAGIAERVSQQLVGQDGITTDSSTNLIVIPDGPLHLLPFSALLDPASDYREPVVERRTVSYLASLAAYKELQVRQSATADGIAILADPIFPQDSVADDSSNMAADESQVALLDRILLRGDPYIPLPGTRRESEAIQQVAGDIPVFALHGNDANRDAVLSGAISSYRILHFATHGVLDDQEPALSGLVLSGAANGSRTEPAVLRSQDIAGLSLKARLVVLSGCETALGQPVHGEGLLGLSRAFFYAGAEQVVSTLWPVTDQATPELMKHFYQALLSGETNTATALQNAKNAVRKDPKWRNPFYWAPYVLQGDWK